VTLNLSQADDLVVHSENCVLFLLTAWVRGMQNQPCSPQQLEELAHNVRVFHLSLSYLITVLPSLEWFRSCSGMERLPRLQAHKTMPTDRCTRSNAQGCEADFPGAWCEPPRAETTRFHTAEIDLDVSPDELMSLATGKEHLKLKTVYVNGFIFHVWAFPLTIAAGGPGSEARCSLALAIGVDDEAMRETLGVWTPVQTAFIEVHLRMPAGDIKARMAMSGGRCSCIEDCLGRSCATIEEVVAPYVAGREQLYLSASIEWAR
jgi:hypothetical protein